MTSDLRDAAMRARRFQEVIAVGKMTPEKDSWLERERMLWKRVLDAAASGGCRHSTTRLMRGIAYAAGIIPANENARRALWDSLTA